MTRGRRGLALLLVVFALGVVDALLAMLWLYSRAEAREAVESLAVSRAEWAAAATLTEAVGWLVARDTLAADTTLRFLSHSSGVSRSATLRRHAAELVEVRAEGRAESGGSGFARRARCVWLGPGRADSVGIRRLAPLVGTSSGAC
jgi:type II secretory pathway component PulK